MLGLGCRGPLYTYTSEGIIYQSNIMVVGNLSLASVLKRLVNFS